MPFWLKAWLKRCRSRLCFQPNEPIFANHEVPTWRSAALLINLQEQAGFAQGQLWPVTMGSMGSNLWLPIFRHGLHATPSAATSSQPAMRNLAPQARSLARSSHPMSPDLFLVRAQACRYENDFAPLLLNALAAII